MGNIYNDFIFFCECLRLQIHTSNYTDYFIQLFHKFLGLRLVKLLILIYVTYSKCHVDVSQILLV